MILVAACGSPPPQAPACEGQQLEPAAPALVARAAPLPGPGEPLVPLVVPDLGAPPKDPAIELVAWGSSVCAALASGAVACWGDWGGWPAEVHRVAGWTGVVGLAASPYLMCGRHRDGRVDCGTYGEEWKLAPITVAGASDVRELAVADDAACVVERGGTVACWIEGGPARFERVRGISGATQLVLGHESGVDAGHPLVAFGCALVAKGRVACFDLYREVAFADDGSPTEWMARRGAAPQLRIATAAITPGLDGITELVVQGVADAPSSMCVRAGRGPLRCGTVTHGTIEGLAPRADQAGVTSWFGNCAVRGDAVSCPASKRKPLATVTLPKLARVAAGEQHACAITEGRVACWGNNDGGQLGTLFTENNATPALGLTDAVDFAASVVTMFAVRANGRLAVWGSSDRDGTDVPRTFSTISDAQRVVAGDELACVSRRGGAVSCWHGIDGTPVEIAALRGATELRTVDGGVVARVGDDWMFVRNEHTAPQVVPGTSGASDLAFTNFWVCARHTHPAHVACWTVPRKARAIGARESGPLVFDAVDELALAPIVSTRSAYLAVRHRDGRAEEIVLDGEARPPQARTVEQLAPDAVHVIASGDHVCAMTPHGPICRGNKYELFNQQPFPAALANATKLVIDRGVCGLRPDHRVLCVSSVDPSMLGSGTAERISPVRVSL